MSLTEHDMRLLSQLADGHSGVVIDNDKYQLVQTRLTQVVHANNFSSVDELMHMLHHRPDKAVRLQVAEALLTHETQFFREMQVFKAIKQLIQDDPQPEYFIWSAGCSFGQEPYSLAMMLDDAKLLNHKPVNIVASDISSKALNQAKLGQYTTFELSRGLTEIQLQKYFQTGELGGRINKNIRDAIDFQVINLNQAWPELPLMDMVLIRNVLIYFDLPTKISLLNRIAKQLKPGGILVMGTGESPDDLHQGFEKLTLESNSVFKRQ